MNDSLIVANEKDDSIMALKLLPILKIPKFLTTAGKVT